MDKDDFNKHKGAVTWSSVQKNTSAQHAKGGRTRFQPASTDLVVAAFPKHARGKLVELWWQDEARIGQQGTLSYVWDEPGSRPPAPRKCRHRWATIFGAICPAHGTSAALVVPYADKPAMTLHLAEISQAVTPGAPAIVIVDGAGWHKPGGRLTLPANISTLRLPAYAPELNPQETSWQFLRQNYLANRIFDTDDPIVQACCDAWNALMQRPERITTLATREWAKQVKV